jgi:hypothetical protein
MENKIPEIEAREILLNYEGSNNQFLDWKRKITEVKNFKLTRPQSEHVMKYKDVVPKVARKYINIVSTFGEKIMEERFLPKAPERIWCEKLLCDSDKAFHIWGKVLDSDQLSAMWLPKAAIVQEEKKLNRVIDYSPYDVRPPMEHQKVAIEKLLANDKFILADDMGLGKALESNTKIYTPSGTKKIGELTVGEKVIGCDGNSYNITGVYPQGIKDLYRVTFNDGYSILCCDEHIWSVSTGANGGNSNLRKTLTIDLTLKQLLDKDLQIKRTEGKNNKLQPTYYISKNGQPKWQIPIVKPINFNNTNKLPINPYLLGLLIGDGGISGKSIRFSSIDDEIINYIKEIITEDLEITKVKGDNCDYSIVTKIGRKNSLTNNLKELGLMGCTSIDKFIPEMYKFSSIEDRLGILQGLMDTDGFCNKSRKNNGFSGTEFCSISEKLVDDVIEIVHSLGGIARKSSRIPKYTYKGIKQEGKRAYRVNIKLQGDMNPFRMERKKNLYNPPQKYKVGRYIKNIEFERKGDAVCISVDSPDKLYVAEHCIVTHNTTSAVIGAIESGAKKVLIVCPASLKINWQREISNYSDRRVLIVEGRKWGSTFDFYIINYDIIKNYHTTDKSEDSDDYKLLVNEGFDLAIVDEAHYISNTTANRTRLLNDVLEKIPKVWLLTGTPMTSRPINYFNLLKIVDSPLTLNWQSYVRRYCKGYQFTVGNRKVWNTSGASNLDELRERTKSYVLRRMKTDILDLPEKIVTPVFVELTSKMYDEELEEFTRISNDKKNDETISVTLNRLMKIRQLISYEKIPYTCELIDKCLEQGKKVIVLTNFTMTLDMLHDKYKKNSVTLDGRMNKDKRQENVDRFQTDDKIKVFIGNIKAAGVGITLTAAEVVIMNDLSFVPADHSQGEDRAYRYGQKNSVLVYYPVFENTIEKVIYNILQKKKNVIDQVMGDGEYSESFSKDLLKSLL